MPTEPPSHKYSFGVLVNRIADEHPLRNLMTWSLLLMEHGETDFWMAVADPRISRAIKQYELHQALAASGVKRDDAQANEFDDEIPDESPSPATAI